MKALLTLVIILISICSVKAQDHTLGKTREQIWKLIEPNTDIKLFKGESTDTLTMQSVGKIVMYYKDNVCYSSKSYLSMSILPMIDDKIKSGNYKKLKENVWLSPSGLVKMEVIILKDTDQFTVETSQVSGQEKN